MTYDSPTADPAAPAASHCARCGVPFACGAHDPATPCWCTRLPPLEPQPDLAGCLCPTCLQAAIAAAGATTR